MTRKERQIDAAVAVAAFAGSLGLLAVGEADAGGIEAPAVVLTALASLPLLWCRRAPLVVFVLTGLASTALGTIAEPAGPPLGPTIALFWLALSGDGSRARTRLTLAVVGRDARRARGGGRVGERSFPWRGAVIRRAALERYVAGGRQGSAAAERMAELEERAVRAEREAERERRLAAAEERMRIARDLHDSAGHAINVILVHAGAGRLQAERDPAAAREAFQTIEDVARETVSEIDQLVGALREDGVPPQEVESPPGSRRSTAWWSATGPPAWTSRRGSAATAGRYRRASTAAPTASFRRRSPMPPATERAARRSTWPSGRTHSSSPSPTLSAAGRRGATGTDTE